VAAETRPVIGLTTYRENAAWGVWQQRADVLQAEYADTVVAAGGVPLLLPPATDAADAAAAVVARIDGLVVCGGADVDPARYGAEPHDRTAGWRPDRDAWEMALLDAAAAAQLPVLGVCRGMQLMAVHAGGQLDQHTPDLVGDDRHSPGGDEFGDVTVTTVPGSRLAALVGAEVEVACHHHQSVRDAPGFTFTARADDGTIEAMEAAGAMFRVGVQWHPEMRTELALVRGLVESAAG
jgi:putative glutamine amidotransferase